MSDEERGAGIGIVLAVVAAVVLVLFCGVGGLFGLRFFAWRVSSVQEQAVIEAERARMEAEAARRAAEAAHSAEEQARSQAGQELQGADQPSPEGGQEKSQPTAPPPENLKLPDEPAQPGSSGDRDE